MHYHCEIVIPPLNTGDVEEYAASAVAAVLAPFSENAPEEDQRGKGFWDWFVIGGRWSGDKLMTRLGKERLEAFWRWLDEQGVTVSSLTCGKQELSPASQIPIVDAKWRELFPEASDIPCPVFKHSGDRLPGDIMPLAEVPPTLECERVIFAGQSWTQSQAWTGPVEARFMLSRSEWNGCNHMPIAWDGTLASALDAYLKTLEGFREEYASAMTPNPQWLTVTVDYHS